MRLHVHIGVENLQESISFYSALFGAQPEKIKGDYAKWMLEEPKINFAISTRSNNTGVNHLGLQVDSQDGLEELRQRFKQARLATYDEGHTTCCYAESDKAWIEDPSGIPWENFYTMADAEVFGTDGPVKPSEAAAGEAKCCAPVAEG